MAFRSSFERVKFRQPGTKHRPDPDIERNGSIKFREKCATTAQEKARHLSRLKFNLGSLADQDERIVQHDPWQCHASEEREREKVSPREGGEKPLLILSSPRFIFRRNSSWISSNQIAFHALEIAIQPWNNN